MRGRADRGAQNGKEQRRDCPGGLLTGGVEVWRHGGLGAGPNAEQNAYRWLAEGVCERVEGGCLASVAWPPCRQTPAKPAKPGRQ